METKIDNKIYVLVDQPISLQEYACGGCDLELVNNCLGKTNDLCIEEEHINKIWKLKQENE